MKNEIFSGTVSLFEKEYNFEFFNDLLTIYIDNEIVTNLFYDEFGKGTTSYTGKKDLPDEYISGKTNDKKEIEFRINKNNYYTNSFIPTTSICKLCIPVLEYIVTVSSFSQPNNSLYAYSSSLKYIFNFVPNYIKKPSSGNATIFEMAINHSNFYKEASCAINDIEFTLSPTFKTTWGYDKFEHLPGICLVFKSNCDKQTIWKLYDAIVYTFMFLHLRKNLFFDDVQLNYNNENMVIFERSYELKEEDFNKVSRKPSVIKWNHAWNKIGNIISFFYNEDSTILLSFIYDSLSERNVYSYDILRKDAAIFEHIFNKVFPDYSHDEKETYDLKFIERRIDDDINLYTGYKKKVYKYLKKQIGNMPFSSKIYYALKFFDNSLVEYNNMYGFNNDDYSSIAEVCAKCRNDVAHGNDVSDLTQELIEKYSYLRLLVIVLYLYKFEYTIEEIHQMINDLYNL